MLGQLYRNNQSWSPRTVPSQLVRGIIVAIEKREITGTNSKAILRYLLDNPSSRSLHLDDILEELGIVGADMIDLETLCRDSIQAMPQIAQDIRAGQTKAIGRLIGDVMKRSEGAADAKSARSIILDLLR
jgi:aspartyl-tRNA(Asn)/glutamyl-tRNA(Gln) amidotransferase subunit B